MKLKANSAVIISAVLLAAVLLSTVFIFSNSLKSSAESHADSNFFVSIAEPLIKAIFGQEADASFFVRKAAHFAEFCMLGVLVCCAVLRVGKKFAGYSWFFVLAVAVVDEMIQKFTGRTSSVSDVIIDFCGAAAGFLTVTVLRAAILYLRRRKENKLQINNRSQQKGTAE